MSLPNTVKDVAVLTATRVVSERAGHETVTTVQEAAKDWSVIFMMMGSVGTAALVSVAFGIPLATLSIPICGAAGAGAFIGVRVGMCIKEWLKRREVAKKAINQIIVAHEDASRRKGKVVAGGFGMELYLRMRELVMDGKEVAWIILDDLRVQCDYIEASACFDLFKLLWVKIPTGMWTPNATCEKCGRHLELANVCVCPIMLQENKKQIWTVHCRENDAGKWGLCCGVKRADVGTNANTTPAQCDDDSTSTPSADSDSEKSIDTSVTDGEFEFK